MTAEKVGQHRTCLEKQMIEFLTDLGFKSGSDFYEQLPVGNYVLDFAFIFSRNPTRGLDIETDGAPWHSTGRQRSRDGFRTHKLKLRGFAVERFGENFTKEEVKSVLLKYGLCKPA
jgi:very-short-patch-repair endonuclease